MLGQTGLNFGYFIFLVFVVFTAFLLLSLLYCAIDFLVQKIRSKISLKRSGGKNE